MLNKRTLKQVPNNTNLMNVFLYEATSETNEEIYEQDFLNPAATIFKAGDIVKLLKKDMFGELLCYVEYFVVKSNIEEAKVDFIIQLEHLFDEKAFKFRIKERESIKESEAAKEKVATKEKVEAKDNK